jgi:hypothetical protein
MLLNPQVILTDFAGTAFDKSVTSPLKRSSGPLRRAPSYLGNELISEQREAARLLRIQLAIIPI